MVMSFEDEDTRREREVRGSIKVKGYERVCPVRCVLYKSVGGVYTADPKIVPEARLIPEISYEEMMEMGSQGAEVINPVAVEWAMLHGVEIFITSMVA